LVARISPLERETLTDQRKLQQWSTECRWSAETQDRVRGLRVVILERHGNSIGDLVSGRVRSRTVDEQFQTLVRMRVDQVLRKTSDAVRLAT
jgi:hypothetical protein